MQKITPHLWFDKEAQEAARFYTSLFKNSKIKSINTLDNTPSGSVDLVSIELAGQEFALISAGPLFKFNPSVSFLIACGTKDEVNAFWEELSEGGSVMMPLQEYPFSEWYGWTQDRYGLSWQVMLMGERPGTQKITPTLMFVGPVCGKAKEAIDFYASVFSDSSIGAIMRYENGEDPDKPGTIKHASFTLEGQHFAAMDSARMHDFAFNEAISFIINCEGQEQVDYYWNKLSADPKAEQCGWLKDKYGLSWQVVPTEMAQMMASGDSVKLARVTEAFLEMKKFDIAKLKKAFDGK